MLASRQREKIRARVSSILLVMIVSISVLSWIAWTERSLPHESTVPAHSPPPRHIRDRRGPDQRVLLVAGSTAEKEKRNLYQDSYAESSEDFIRETVALLKSVLTEEDAFRESFDITRRTATVRKFNSTAQLVAIKHQSARERTDSRIKVMVVCGMHAREMFSSDLCRSWLLYTALAVKTNQTPEEEVAPIDWLYVPVANPDGRDAVAGAYAGKEGHFPWTKCHRGNLRGVDLNRNWRMYDDDLYKEYGNKDRKTHEPHRFENRVPNAEENPGQESFSEAETAVLRDLLDEFRPDVLLSIHTGTVSISYPMEDTVDEPPTYLGLMRMAGRLVDWSGCRSFKPRCLAGQSSRILYVSKGTMVDYAYRLRRSAMPFTVEAYGGPPPHESRTWDEDPDICFYFYNPPQRQLVAYLKRWKPLWHGFYYMNARDRILIKKLAKQFEDETDDDEEFKGRVRPTGSRFRPEQIPRLARAYRSDDDSSSIGKG
jgi:hypothetical protein